MDRDRCRELIKLALQKREFPPRLHLPEVEVDSTISLFSCPYVVWVPESTRASRRPACIDRACACTPTVKEYVCRVVHDTDHVTHFLYIKYVCSGTGETRPVFSTKSERYLALLSDSVQLQLPYVLQGKGGKSKPLFQQIHDGIMSADGLERVRVAVERARYSRYYFLLSLFAAHVRDRQRAGQLKLAPTPPTVESFMKTNAVPCHQAFTQFWLDQTRMLSVLANHVMRRLEIKRVLRMDHSRKLAKKLRKHTATTRQDQKEMHLLLLIQNEAGQVVARALTRSENNEEVKEVLLKEIKDHIPEEDVNGESEPVYLVTDNANALRGMIASLFGSAVSVRQDPFHVFQRLAEKIKDRGTRKLFSKALRDALYDGDEEFKDVDLAAADVAAVCAKVVPSDRARMLLSCSVAEWEGSVKSNLAQIMAGDLYVHREGAGSCKIVSTSQLESVHAQLKRLINRDVSYDVGLRVLDIYLLEHNLRAGAKFWRNPRMGSLDLLSMCRAAIRCHGMLPESPQMEFALSVCDADMPPPKYHYETKHIFPFSSLAGGFRAVRVDTEEMEARLHPHHEFRNDIRRLLLSHSTSRCEGQSLFAQSLRLLTAATEDASPLSHHEYELLRQVCADQRAHGKPSWARCPLTTTLLYNIAAEKGEATRFKLKKRSSETLRKHIDHIDARLETTTEKATKAVKPLFNFHQKPVNDGGYNEHESLLQAELFTLLRSMGSKRFVIEQFCRLYDFAAALLDNVRPKTEARLRKRWEALRKVETRASTTIKFPLHVVQSALGSVNADVDCAPTATSNPVDQESASFSDGLLDSNSVLSVVETPTTTQSGVGFDTNALACHNIDLETNSDPASEITPHIYPIVGLEASALLPSNERDPVEMISKKDLQNMRTMSEAMDTTLTADALCSRVKRLQRQREDDLARERDAKRPTATRLRLSVFLSLE